MTKCAKDSGHYLHEVAPRDGEPVLTTNVPNAFGGTNLRDLID